MRQKNSWIIIYFVFFLFLISSTAASDWTIPDKNCGKPGDCETIYEDGNTLNSIYLKIVDFFTHIDEILSDGYYNKTEADTQFLDETDYANQIPDYLNRSEFTDTIPDYINWTDGNLTYALNISLDQYVDWITGNDTYALNISLDQYLSLMDYNAQIIDYYNISTFNEQIVDYINWTDGNKTYVKVEGDTMTGNLSAQNITAQEYFYGQPLAGGIQGGIVWAAEIDGFGQLNLSHEAGTLNLGYPDMIVRIVTTPNGDEKYCDIAADTVTTNDNAHEAYVVSGADCSIMAVPVSTFVDADINQAGNTPIFHAMAHSGEIEVHQGMPIQNRNYIRSRILHLKTINLDVLNGMSLVEEEDLDFTINSGEYVFVDQPVTASIQNITDGATLELFGRDGTNYFYDDSANGLNLTTCEDASQDQVECSLTSRYRRYFIFITGYEEGDDDTLLHQRLALDSVNYVTIANCLNIETNPVTYDLPDIYDYTAVPLFAYCLQAKNTELSDGAVIDLRRFKTGSASGGIDTSVFLTKDGSRPLTDNWDAEKNITVDTLLADYFEGDGSRLTGLTNHTDEVYNTWGEWFYNMTTSAINWVLGEGYIPSDNVVFSNGTNLPSTWDVTNYTAGSDISIVEHVITYTGAGGAEVDPFFTASIQDYVNWTDGNNTYAEIIW